MVIRSMSGKPARGTRIENSPSTATPSASSVKATRTAPATTTSSGPGSDGAHRFKASRAKIAPRPEGQRNAMRLGQAAGERGELLEEPVGVERQPEELRRLADEDEDGDAVKVARQDGPREEVRHEAQPRDAAGDQDPRRHQGEQGEQRGVTRGVAGGERTEAGGDDQTGGRVGADDQLAGRTENRVGEQREDRRVDPDDDRHASEIRVGDADRQRHRGHREPGAEVAPDVRPAIGPQQAQAGGQPREARSPSPAPVAHHYALPLDRRDTPPRRKPAPHQSIGTPGAPSRPS